MKLECHPRTLLQIERTFQSSGFCSATFFSPNKRLSLIRHHRHLRQREILESHFLALQRRKMHALIPQSQSKHSPEMLSLVQLQFYA
jgi:hypothetical protein